MRAVSAGIALALCLLAPAISVSSDAPPSEFGGEVFLVKDKTIAGFDMNLFVSSQVGFNLELAMGFVHQDAPTEGLDGSFFGFLVAPHIFYNRALNPALDGRIGIGADIWPVSGIDGNEVKYALPLYAELSLGITPTLRAFIRARGYLLSSDGLAPGENYRGDTQIPVLISVGIAGRPTR